jgi:DNA repair protein RecO (recombination protein O)
MSLIEVVAERKNRGNFDYIKEVKILSSLEAVGFDVAKSSISMFLNEILCKVLADAGEDVVMFNFLYTSLEQFISKPFIPDFHLRFLTALMRELGCFPKDNFTSSNMVFSIEKSCFVSNSVGGVEECSLGMYFHHLLSGGLFPVDNAEVIPYIWRNSLLEMIMKYYTFHVTSLLQIRSHEILKTLLHS